MQKLGSKITVVCTRAPSHTMGFRGAGFEYIYANVKVIQTSNSISMRISHQIIFNKTTEITYNFCSVFADAYYVSRVTKKKVLANKTQ
jgi:hypothetical protein